MKILKVMVAVEGLPGFWDVEGITDNEVILSRLSVRSTHPYEAGKVYQYLNLEEFKQFTERKVTYEDL